MELGSCRNILSEGVSKHQQLRKKSVATKGVGYMDGVEALLPYRNPTNIFMQISKKVSYFKILIHLRTCITCNGNIASFDVLHKPFIRIGQLFSSICRKL
jgi:hypothetical protein